MSAPGLGNVPPPSADWMAKKIKELEKAIADLRTARSGNYTTIDGTLDVPGNLNVSGTTSLDGSLTLQGGAVLTASGDVQSANYDPGNAGWKLDGTTGDIEINDITLRGGIIGDDALTNPTDLATFEGVATFSMTVPTSFASVISKSVTVPAGFTKAFVLAIASYQLFATTWSTTAFVALKTRVNSHDGPQLDVAFLGSTSAAVPVSTTLTGLSGGGSVTVQGWAEDSGSNTAPAFNSVTLNGLVVFLR